MYRLSRSAPMLALCAVVGILTYCQFSQQPIAPDNGNSEVWSKVIAQRIEALENRSTPQPLIAAAPIAPPVRERVIELPEDGALWSTVVVYSGDDYGQRLKSNFENTPQLLALRTQTHYYELPPNHWWVRQNLPGARFPLVLLQRPINATEAKVIYKATGANIPSDGGLLAGEIAQAIEDCCPRPGPRPTPTPTPTPAPVQPDPIPDLRPNAVQPAQDESLGTLSYALVAGAALGGAYLGFKQGD